MVGTSYAFLEISLSCPGLTTLWVYYFFFGQSPSVSDHILNVSLSPVYQYIPIKLSIAQRLLGNNALSKNFTGLQKVNLNREMSAISLSHIYEDALQTKGFFVI